MKPIATQEDIEKVSQEIACELVSKTDEGKIRILELEERFKASAKFLDEATDQISTSWLKWLSDSKEYLDSVRAWRMAIENENRVSIQSCKDALDFLGSEEYKEKMKSMRELIELSERLKSLKDSGFLDSLVDTLVKVKP